MLEVLLDVLELAVALDVPQALVKMSLAAQMHDLESLQQLGQVAAHCVVDRDGALAAAHDHEHGLVRRETADLQAARLVAGEKFAADRSACEDCFALGEHLQRLREVAADLLGRAEAELVGQARRHVGLVDHARNVERARRAHHRHADKAALGEDDVRFVFFEKFAGLPVAVDHAEGIREILHVKISPQLSRRDSYIGQPEVGDQILLDPLLGPYISDLIARFLQIRQERNIGRNMSGSPAAGQYDFLLGCVFHGFLRVGALCCERISIWREPCLLSVSGVSPASRREPCLLSFSGVSPASRREPCLLPDGLPKCLGKLVGT